MEISILQQSQGAANARGITVVIDVFRAFTVECHAFAAGAKRIYPMADIDLAYAMKQRHPDYILVGERKGRPPQGFDFGNSPWQISRADLTGKTLIHTTSAGTQGISAAVGADEILVGALVNAAATAEYIRRKNPAQVSLVCMGFADKHPTDEDTFCAEYLRARLTGESYDQVSAVKTLRTGSGARFFDPKNQAFSPPQDFDLCCRFDWFPFALPVQPDEQGILFTHPEPVQ